jgi:hypothetical protein
MAWCLVKLRTTLSLPTPDVIQIRWLVSEMNLADGRIDPMPPVCAVCPSPLYLCPEPKYVHAAARRASMWPKWSKLQHQWLSVGRVWRIRHLGPSWLDGKVPQFADLTHDMSAPSSSFPSFLFASLLVLSFLLYTEFVKDDVQEQAFVIKLMGLEFHSRALMRGRH